MKALILAAGRGKRLGEKTNSQNKAMLRLNGKPVIEYSLENAAETEVNEIVIVVGHRAEDIINAYGNRYKRKPVRYVIQYDQQGLVHAIECSVDAIGGDDFLLLLGDEILINQKHKLMIKQFKDENLFGICGIVIEKDRSRISKTYNLIQDDQRRIYRLIEKPRKPMNDLMGTGNCLFKNDIFSYIPQTPINQQRKEKELPDLIQCAIDDGNIVKSFVACDRYFNINSEDDLKEAEAYISSIQTRASS